MADRVRQATPIYVQASVLKTVGQVMRAFAYMWRIVLGQSSASSSEANTAAAEVFISNGRSLEETVAALRDDIVR